MKEKAGLYIHIPFCKSKCAYCDFFSCTKKENLIEPYINALCNEISFTIKNHESYEVDTVFMGGGTPSIIPFPLIKKLCNLITSLFSPKEFTIEANPDNISEEFLKTLNDSKVTRLSIGIQSLNEKSLKECNRRADLQTNINALELIKKFWRKNFSVDMISALPFETEKTLKASLEKIIEYKPDHISLYSLMLEEETPLYESYKNYNSDEADKLWLFGRDILLSNGYAQYEVSNFCTTAHECRHNLKYWQQENYFGCGSGATGTIYTKTKDDFYAERRTNTKDVEKYIQFWGDLSGERENLCTGAENKFYASQNSSTTANAFTASQNSSATANSFTTTTLATPPCERETVPNKTCQLEFFMMGLRLLKGVNEKDFFARYNKNFPPKIIKIFQSWQNQKLAKITSENGKMKFLLNEEGILFLNKILEEIIDIL